MKKLADIYINIPVKTIVHSYTYIIPEQFSFLQAGSRVVVPFGARKMEGFVVKIYPMDEENSDLLKEIVDIIDTESYFTTKIMQTARFMAQFYLCSLGETLRLFIPGKNSIKIRQIYIVKDKNAEISNKEKAVYEYIKANPECDIKQLQAIFKENAEIIIKSLQKKNIIDSDYAYKNRGKNKYKTYIKINSTVVTTELLAAMTRKKVQKKALEFLGDEKFHSIDELKNNGFSSTIVKALTENNYAVAEEKQIFRDSYDMVRPQELMDIELTDEQKNVMQQISPYIEQGLTKMFLLHGVTGSGKTQIYIEAAVKVLAQEKQALILVPEIVLTGQLVVSLKKVFADDVVVIHSRLTVNERNDAFMRIRTNNAKIIIGARSAIFAPFFNLGLIVMDEEHDASYKQDESPRYHTRDIAVKMAEIYSAVLILGSATPSIESYFAAQNNEYQLLEMPHRIDNKPLPQIRCIDMREELHFGNRHILSRQLVALIEETLQQKQQIIIMLNRRGFSTFVMCRSCGLVMKCPQCGLPLVYHRQNYLQCHHCDIRLPVPDVCPGCQSRYIKFFGSGTEKLEQELTETFPNARAIRLDRDTTGKKMAHQEILQSFKAGRYDILLGTQMVAKGHDIPNVTAVGIISADASLNMPDFRAAERCFGLITQTAGRAGRGDVKGKVIIQSYNPEHYAVLCGIKQDYAAFYKQELHLRKELFYPPYAKLIKLTIQDKVEQSALDKALQLKEKFRETFKDFSRYQIIGPAPSIIANFRGIYRFNLLVKTVSLADVNAFLRVEKIDIDRAVKIDINPLNTM